MAFNLITALWSSSSPQSSLTMLNAVQLILLLPLIGAYLSPNVLDFIRGMKACLLNFDFMPANPIHIGNVDNLVDFDQQNPYLYLIGLESGSSVINIASVSGISLTMPLIHVISATLYCIIKKKFSEKKCTHLFIRKVFRGLTFGAYIRFLYQVYIFLVLASVSEIYMYSGSSVNRRRSIGVAYFVAVFCVAFICTSVWQFFKSLNDNNLNKMYYFIEFFSGIKGTRKARIYALMFLLRRTVLCCIVLLLHDVMSLTVLNSTFVLFQVCYLWFSVFFKPFSEIKDNILEMMNEVFYTLLWSSLIYFQTQDKWSQVFENIYIGLMMLNNWIFALISFCNFIYNYFSFHGQSNIQICQKVCEQQAEPR